MKKIAILQSNYIPWKGYFDIIRQSDIFVIYDEVQYTKNDWRNRNLIKTPNGIEWLTIPVNQKNLDQKINETFVSTTNWNKKHWNSILCNYSKSPYFKTYWKLYSMDEDENLFWKERKVWFSGAFERKRKINDHGKYPDINIKNHRIISEICKNYVESGYLWGLHRDDISSK